MNPAKLTALYDAQFHVIREDEDTPRQERKQEQKKSLREYMRGG